MSAFLFSLVFWLGGQSLQLWLEGRELRGVLLMLAIPAAVILAEVWAK